MKNDDLLLKPGDRIHLIIYRDHATITNETLSIEQALEKARKDPKLLFSVGKIVNLNSNDPFYMVLSAGAVNYLKKPYNYETIEKDCIVSMEEIYIIP